MAGTQAVEGASRGRPDFELYPSEIYVERRKGVDLYDPRCELPVHPGIVHSLTTLPQSKDLVVWKDDAGRWVLIDGHQTHTAAAHLEGEADKAGLPRRKLRLTTLKLATIAEVLRFKAVANLRVPTPRSMTARAVLKLRAHGVDDAEIVRCHPEVEVVAAVETYVKLAEMHPDVHAAVDAGAVAITAAVRKLAKLPRNEQAAAIEKMLNGDRRPAKAALQSGRPSVAAIRKIAAADDKAKGVSGAAFLTALRYVLGDVTAKQARAAVSGIDELLSE